MCEVRMIQINKGPCVSGPFDRKEESVVFYPDEYPDNKPPPEDAEVKNIFSKAFPEGAIYHWHADKKEWHYVGPMSEESQDGARELFGCFGVEPEPPL